MSGRPPAVAGWLLIAALALAACGGRPLRPAHPPAATAPGPSDAELLARPDPRPQPEPRAHLGNPPFYEVYGQRYTVLASAAGYLERGVASWYGPDFHGGRTATGEPYDMYSMTAAHRTLPLPAYVSVTNLSNHRAVVVRVNDRGPFKADRIIDLSFAAALKLGMVRDGTTLVEVRALEPAAVAAAPAAAAPDPVEIYAQAGAFAVEHNAAGLRDRIRAAGVGNVLLRAVASGERTLYQVRIGPIASVPAFDALLARLRAIGIDGVTLAPN